jgi:beta-galactosidase
MADPASIGLVHDQMASYTGRWAQMELQPGQINWSGVPVQPYPGAVRLWLWTAFAHGAEFVTTYRYRQPRFGVELFHHALAGTDGVTLSRGGREFCQVIREIHRLDLNEDAGRGEEPVPTVGLLLDFDQLWYFKTLPQSRKWDQPAYLKMWYAAIKRLGLNVRILHPGRDLPVELPLIVAPGMQMLDEFLMKRFERYLTNGGHLVLTCRTGLMNRSGQLWEGPTAMPILPLIGARIDEYDVLPDDALAHVEMDGRRYPWNVWGDLIIPDAQTHVIARYADQFYAGTAAVVQRHHGLGTATYCGVYPQDDFIEALMQQLARTSGLPVKHLPSRVHLMKRGQYHVLLNYRDQSVEAPAPENAEFVIGNRTVGPADVAVWR